MQPRRKPTIVSEINRTDSVVSEKAVLVGVLLPDRQTDELPLDELDKLFLRGR